MVSNRQRKKRFHLLKNCHARGRMSTNETEIVTEIEIRGTLDLRRKPTRKSKDREVERGIETETGENVNAANRRNLTHRTKIRTGTEIAIEETIERGKENGRERGTEIAEENATDLDIEVWQYGKCSCRIYTNLSRRR